MEEEKEEQRIQWHASQLDELCKTLKEIKSRLERGEYSSKAFYDKMSKVLKTHHHGLKAVQNDQLFHPGLVSSYEEDKAGSQRHSKSRNASGDNGEKTTGTFKVSSLDAISVGKGPEWNADRLSIKSCSVRIERLATPLASAPPRRRKRRSAKKETFIRGLQSMKSIIDELFGGTLSSEEGDSDGTECSQNDDSGVADVLTESSGNDDTSVPDSCGDALVDVAIPEAPCRDEHGRDFISPVPTLNPHEPNTEEQEPLDGGRIAEGEADVKPFAPNGGRRNIRPVRETLLPETEAAVKKEVERSERIAERDALMEEILPTETEESQCRNFVLDFDPATNEPVMLDSTLVPKLKDYQLEGIKFMYDNCFESIRECSRPESEGGGCILAHCMGLGKTFQVVAFVHTILTCHLMNVKRVMVLCPPTTVDNWVFEFNSWLQECRDKIVVHNFVDMKSKPVHKRVNFLQNWYESGGVLICSYSFFRSTLTQNNVLPETMEKLQQLLLSPGADYVVCDEGHILKSSDSKLVPILNQVRTKRRVILTGTPLQNNLMEYYTMLNFVKPNLLGTASEFRNGFANPIKNGQHSDSTIEDVILMKKRSYVLHKLPENCVHRLGYSVLVPLLQPKYEYAVVLRPSELQKKLYNGYLNFIGPAQTRISQNRFFGDFTQVSKMLSHPINLTYTTTAKKGKSGSASCWWQQYVTTMAEMAKLEQSNKFIVLFDIIEFCIAEGDKIVVFSQYKYTLDLIEEALQTNREKWRKNIDYYRLDGSIVSEKRQKIVNDFNDSESCAKLFLLSTRAGGVGINLVCANRVILFDASFNPAMDVQAVFRTYRLGQMKPCYVYRLLTGGTMEEAIYRQQITKLSLAERVVDEQNPERHFREDEFINMYAPLPVEAPSDKLLGRPVDTVLEKVIRKWRHIIQTYLDHKDLLENQDKIDLTEEDKQAALLEYEKLKDRPVDRPNEAINGGSVPSDMQNWEEINTQLAEMFDQPKDVQKNKRQEQKSGGEIRFDKKPSQSEDSLTEISKRQANKPRAAVVIPPEAQVLAAENPEEGPFKEVPVPPSPKQPPLVVTLDDSSNQGEVISCLEDPRINNDGTAYENVRNLSSPSSCCEETVNSVPSPENHIVPPAGVSGSSTVDPLMRTEHSVTQKLSSYAVKDTDSVSKDPSNANGNMAVSDTLPKPVQEAIAASNSEAISASPRSNYDDYEYEENPSEDESAARAVAVVVTAENSVQGEETENYRCWKRRKTCSNEIDKESNTQEESNFDSSKLKSVQDSGSCRGNDHENNGSMRTPDSAHSLEKASTPQGAPLVSVSAPDADVPGQVPVLSKTHCEGSDSNAISSKKRGSVKARLGPKVPENSDQTAKKHGERRSPSPIIFDTVQQDVDELLESACKNEKVKEGAPRGEREYKERQMKSQSQPYYENRKGSTIPAPNRPRERQSHAENRGRGRGLPPGQQRSRRPIRLPSHSRHRSEPSEYSQQHYQSERPRGFYNRISSSGVCSSRQDSRRPDYRHNLQVIPREGNEEPCAWGQDLSSCNNYENARIPPLLPYLRPALLPTPEEPFPFHTEENTFYTPMFTQHSHTYSSGRNWYDRNC